MGRDIVISKRLMGMTPILFSAGRCAVVSFIESPPVLNKIQQDAYSALDAE